MGTAPDVELPLESAPSPYVIDPVNELHSWDAAVNLNWKLGDAWSLLGVLAHRVYKNSFAEDTDGSPLEDQGVPLVPSRSLIAAILTSQPTIREQVQRAIRDLSTSGMN